MIYHYFLTQQTGGCLTKSIHLKLKIVKVSAVTYCISIIVTQADGLHGEVALSQPERICTER